MSPQDEANEQPNATESAPPPIQAALEISQSPNRTRATVDLIRILAEHPEHSSYIKQLVEAEAQRDLFDQDYRTARVFAISGKFDDIKGSTPEQAVAQAMTKIRIGREWGMNDSDSIAFIYFTNGRPAVMTEILATKVQQAGYSWDIDWDFEKTKGKNNKEWNRCVGCTLWLKQFNRDTNRYEPVLDRKGQAISASFTEADADNAEIHERGAKIALSAKWNFKAWPQDMYFWRAMSRLRKYYLTGIMRGAIQFELATDYEPVTSAPALPAPAEEETAPPERKPLRDRILSGKVEEQAPLAME
jgi:hypothetical protein